VPLEVSSRISTLPNDCKLGKNGVQIYLTKSGGLLGRRNGDEEDDALSLGPVLMKASDINDLRTALEFLESTPGQLISTDAEVDPYLELAGVYRRVGAGTPAPPPTRLGPAMIFKKVKGHDLPVVVGVLAGRERTALLLGSSASRLMFDLMAALEHPVPPVLLPAGPRPRARRWSSNRRSTSASSCPPWSAPRRTVGCSSTWASCAARILRRRGGRHLSSHVPAWSGDHDRGVHARPAHRLLSAQSRSERQTVSRVGQHRPGPCDPRGHIFRGAYHAPRFRRVDGSRRAKAAAGGVGGLRVSTRAGACKSRDRAGGEFRPGEYADEDAINRTGWAMPEFPGYEGTAHPTSPYST